MINGVQLYDVPDAGEANMVFDGVHMYQAIGYLEPDGSLSGLNGRRSRKARKAKRKAKKKVRKTKRHARKVKRVTRRKKVFKKIKVGVKKVAKGTFKVVKKVIPIVATVASFVPIFGTGVSMALMAADYGINALEARKARKDAEKKAIAERNKIALAQLKAKAAQKRKQQAINLARAKAEQKKRISASTKAVQARKVIKPFRQTNVRSSQPKPIRVAYKVNTPRKSGIRNSGTRPFSNNRQSWKPQLQELENSDRITRIQIETTTKNAMRL